MKSWQITVGYQPPRGVSLGYAFAMELIHTAHVPSGDGPFPTLIALHGFGASAHDLLGLAPHLGEGRLMTLCPQGALSLQVGPGMLGYSWFSLVPGQPPDARAFLKSTAQLRGFVDQARQRYPAADDKVVPLGFSQGGMMAFDLALRAPQRFAGVVALSSWLPEILAANLPRMDAQKGFPVLVLHGTQDDKIPIDRARESRDALETFGVDLTYQEFAMGHEIRPEVLRVLNRWLVDKVL